MLEDSARSRTVEKEPRISTTATSPQNQLKLTVFSFKHNKGVCFFDPSTSRLRDKVSENSKGKILISELKKSQRKFLPADGYRE